MRYEKDRPAACSVCVCMFKPTKLCVVEYVYQYLQCICVAYLCVHVLRVCVCACACVGLCQEHLLKARARWSVCEESCVETRAPFFLLLLFLSYLLRHCSNKEEARLGARQMCHFNIRGPWRRQKEAE